MTQIKDKTVKYAFGSRVIFSDSLGTQHTGKICGYYESQQDKGYLIRVDEDSEGRPYFVPLERTTAHFE